jgi:hypothetical protein
MRKVLGLTLALLLTLTISAVANDRSITLEDGITLSVSDSQITGLTVGDQVPAMFEMDGGTTVVSGTPIDTLQAE